MLSTATSFTRYKMRCFEKTGHREGNECGCIYLFNYLCSACPNETDGMWGFLQYVEGEFLTMIYYVSHSTLI